MDNNILLFVNLALFILLSLHFSTEEVSQAKSSLSHTGCKVSSGGYDLLTNSCSISQLDGSARRPQHIH